MGIELCWCPAVAWLFTNSLIRGIFAIGLYHIKARKHKSTKAKELSPPMTSIKDNHMGQFKLDEIRERIDQLDHDIIALLAERFQLTESVGHYKAQHKLAAQDPSRESQQFKKITELSKQFGLNAEYSVQVYRRIIDIVIMRHQELQKGS